METHPTEMSQGENDYEKDLQHLTSTIAGKIGKGVQKTESFFSSAKMSQGENDYEKDLQQLTYTVAGKIGEGTEKAESFFSSACIYRVPEDLRKLNERAYNPRLIAIGPLHREDEHLQTPFQHVKLSYTNYLLSRLTTGMQDQLELAKQKKLTVLQECLAELKTSVDDAKKFYAEEVTLDEEMMLVDGCFILEFLYRCRPRTRTIPNRLDKNWSLPNYVRWCYRKMIRPEQHSNKKEEVLMPSDCVLGIFGCTTATAEEEVQSGNVDHRAANYHHILHILHDWYLPKKNLHEGCLPHDQTKQKKISYREMPSASELVYAGVKFVPDAGNDMFKFKFSEPKGLFWWCRRARFEIPPLPIYDETESYLRNLIALEQSCPGFSRHVSSYADVMDMLVNTDKDIQVLEKAGVLRNCLGATGDATDLFNNLCKEIFCGKYFLDTSSKATEYSERFWPKNMAHVRRTYFDSPWTFIAFVVGFIVFVISLLGFVRDSIKKG